MEKKQIAWYLIFGGLGIFILEFVSTILSFISNHPFLGVACILIGGGMFVKDKLQNFNKIQLKINESRNRLFNTKLPGRL